jgi:hypothetical protein
LIGAFSCYCARSWVILWCAVFVHGSDFEHFVVTQILNGVVEGFLVVFVALVDCTLDGEVEVLAGTEAGNVVTCTPGSANAGADC